MIVNEFGPGGRNAPPSTATTSAGDTICRNCGTALVGAHCHACGQAGHLHRTIGAIGHEIAHGVFHFDGKIWHTLPLLVARPGELTRRYIDGERARFVSPMALFLFTVFLMFAIVANLPGWKFADADMMKPGVAAKLAETRTALAQEQATLTTRIADLTQRLAKARASSEPDADRIASLEQRLAKARQDRTAAATTARLLPAPAPTNTAIETAADPGSFNWFERKWEHAKANPELVLYKVKTSAYKFSWALIPISLPFIWLLFPFRRDVGMYDHAIFAIYSLSFMSLLVIVLTALYAIGVSVDLVWVAALLIPPFHLYRQLKGTYRLSRAGALWRTFLLLNFTVFTTTFFVMMLVYLGVAD